MRAPLRASLIALILVAAITLGCATHTPDSNRDSSDHPFQANVSAQSTSVAAEVVTELIEETPISDTSKKDVIPQGANNQSQTSVVSGNPILPGTLVSGHGLSSRDILYKVKTGDTLMKISFEVFGNVYRWREIYNTNKSKISNFNAPPVGTVLLIHATHPVAVQKFGTPYFIKRGDTLSRISNWVYGTFNRWREIWHNNRQLIHNPNKIYAGFTLFYRGGHKPQTSAPAASIANIPAAHPRQPASTADKK